MKCFMHNLCVLANLGVAICLASFLIYVSFLQMLCVKWNALVRLLNFLRLIHDLPQDGDFCARLLLGMEGGLQA